MEREGERLMNRQALIKLRFDKYKHILNVYHKIIYGCRIEIRLILLDGTSYQYSRYL